jgi:hypothetical protein
MAFALVFIKGPSALVCLHKFYPSPTAFYSSRVGPKTVHCPYSSTKVEMIIGLGLLLLENTCKRGLRSKMARIN